MAFTLLLILKYSAILINWLIPFRGFLECVSCLWALLFHSVLQTEQKSA